MAKRAELKPVSESNGSKGPPFSLVVLGCRVGESGPKGALLRRLERARALVEELGAPTVIVMSGGKGWNRRVEAEAMAEWWQTQGLPGPLLVENRSQNTRENARESSVLLAGASRVYLVTCDFHQPRAQAEFARQGCPTLGIGALSPGGRVSRLRRRAREFGARLLSVWLPILLLGTTRCEPHKTATKTDAASTAAEAVVPSLGESRPMLPPHPGAVTTLQARAREPAAEDEELFSRALLGSESERRFGAMGLGQLCLGRKDSGSVEEHLLEAASLWLLGDNLPSQTELEILAQALGSCASDRAELELRAWLGRTPQGMEGRLASAAAYGLGTLVDRRSKLEDQTLSRLLELAESSKNSDLLYPLGRITRLSRAVSERTIEVAGKLLLDKSLSGTRRSAIFALGSAGSAASSALSAIVESPKFQLTERTAAAQSLARLGERGNRELDRLTHLLIERGIPKTPDSDEWVVLLATLHSLTEVDRSSEALDLVRRGPLPEPSLEPSLRAERRRLIHLRCRAAELQAKGRFSHPHLRNCDPDQSFIGKLATLRVLDKLQITGPAASLLAQFLGDRDAMVVESALALAAAHREFGDVKSAVIRLGRSADPRLRGAALSAIAAHADRFQTEAGPEPEIVALVGEALSPQSPLSPEEQNPSQQLWALEAAGALQALTLKPTIETYCSRDESVAARVLGEAASRALALLGDPHHDCRARPRPTTQALSLPTLASYELQSELGPIKLTLNAELSPASVAALEVALGLGLYANATVKSSREGILLEWAPPDLASPDSGAPRVLLAPAETSPACPRAGDVLFQPPEVLGGQRSLLFVLADAPQLAGKKAQIGRFEGPVQHLVPGDQLTFVAP